MTGIERLREFAKGCRLTGQRAYSNAIGDIADQIEREQDKVAKTDWDTVRKVSADMADRVFMSVTIDELLRDWSRKLNDATDGHVASDSHEARAPFSRMRVLAVVTDMERHVLGHEGMEDSPVARWARELREALDGNGRKPVDYVSVSAYDLPPEEDRDAIAWVRERGGLDSVKKLLDWVVGHCSTKQQLDFDFWLSGRVMHELGFDEDMADRDEVERRLRDRLMPEGYEWPRYEDGKPVRIGDVVSDVEVRSVVFRDGGILLSDCTSVPGWGTWRSYKEPIRRPAPKVLDADGVEIREKRDVWWVCEGDERGVHAERLRVETILPDGLVECSPYNGGTWVSLEPSELYVNKPVPASDGRPLREGETVWDVDGRGPLTVWRLPDKSDMHVSLKKDGTFYYRYSEKLTHERPVADTWERLEKDAEKDPCSYFGFDGEEICGKCPASGKNCEQAMARDIVRRARALAERERGE